MASQATSFYSLFQTPGPWLHSSTTLLASSASIEEAPGLETLAKIIETANPWLSDYREGVVPALISGVFDHSKSIVEGLSEPDRKTVGKYLDITDASGPGMMNNSTYPAIRNGLLPALVLDALLHMSDPTSSAAVIQKAGNRPQSEKIYRQVGVFHYIPERYLISFRHFYSRSSWYATLKAGYSTYQKAAAIRAKPRVNVEKIKNGRKKECLENLRQLNSAHRPGSTASNNITQAAFMLTALLEGCCVLTNDQVVEISFRNAKRREPSITRREVEGVLNNPNADGIPATLAVGLSYSFIHLATDINYAARSSNPGTSVYENWKAMGNTHRVALDHPLGILDRKFLQLLLSVAVGKLSSWELLDTFFTSPEVLVILKEEPSPQYLNALKFTSDSLEDPSLERIDSEDEAAQPEKVQPDKTAEGKSTENKEQPGDANTKQKKQKNKTQVLAPKEDYIKPVTRTSDKTLPKVKAIIVASASSGKSKTQKKVQVKEPLITFVSPTWELPMVEPEQVSLQKRAMTHPVVFAAPRSVEPTPMDIRLHSPGKAGSVLFQYNMFAKFKTDREMIKAMLNSQTQTPDGLPLFMQPSAKDPNPNLKPSDTQSVLHVCTKAEFLALDRRTQWAESPPPFDETTLSMFRDPRKLCTIQDMGLDTMKKHDDYLRSSPLTTMLPHPDRPVLNAIHHPLPHTSYSATPGLHTFTSIEHAMTHLQGHPNLPDVHSPWADLRWGLVGTQGARSPTHLDIMATEMEVITGGKMVCIGVPRADRFKDNHYQADLSSSFMRHGTRHFIISLEDTIAHGLHTIQSEQAEAAVQVILHHIVTEDASTNASHDSARWLLVRLFIFWVEQILQNAPLESNHFPDIETKYGLLQLLYLQSYVILYPALDFNAYAAHAHTTDRFGDALPMHIDRYREYEFALFSIMRLGAHIESCLDVYYDQETTEEPCSTFPELSERAVIHMACCLSRYRQDWISRRQKEDSSFKHGPGITPRAFNQQLKRALAGYNHVLHEELVDVADFKPTPHYDIGLEQTRMVNDFEAELSTEIHFFHFLPWDAGIVEGNAGTMPMKLIPASLPVIGEKRVRIPSSPLPDGHAQPRKKKKT
ncbi:hypothetical protein C8R47DRAFT_1231045 [Mycena vitilis]|nr:hypothetical protein C8R47DRAFT_1231045 [Mycena vitilis]